MATDVKLRMVVPIPDRDIPGGVARLTFASWLPLLDKDAIVIERDNMTAKLGFNLSDLSYPHIRNPEELSNHGNVLVNSITVVMKISDVKDEIVEFLAHRDGGQRDMF